MGAHSIPIDPLAPHPALGLRLRFLALRASICSLPNSLHFALAMLRGLDKALHDRRLYDI